MSFAALQSRANATALNRLGQDVVLAGVTVRALFDQIYTPSEIGAAGIARTQSSLGVLTSSVPTVIMDWVFNYTEPANPADLEVVIDAITYTIVALEHDSIGMSTLILERA
jgi:hypothetical protein